MFLEDHLSYTEEDRLKEYETGWADRVCTVWAWDLRTEVVWEWGGRIRYERCEGGRI